jgi:WD40 repeat protein
MTMRGMAPSGLLLAAPLADAAWANRAAASVTATVTAALRFAAGASVDGRVESLAVAVIQNMWLAKAKTAAALMLLAIVITAGTVGLTRAALATPARNASDDLQTDSPSRRAEPAAEAKSRLDAHGDPLPDGALFRLGTTRFRHGGAVTGVVLTADGKTLATAGESVRLWDVASGKPGLVIPASPDIPGAASSLLDFSPDGQTLYFLDQASLVAKDVVTGQSTVLLRATTGGDIHAVHAAPDGKSIAIGTSKGVRLMELPAGTIRWQTKNTAAVSADKHDRLLFTKLYSLGLFAPDGKTVAVNSSDTSRSVVLLDTGSGKELRRIELAALLVQMAFSPDGRKIAVTERDSSVRVYDVPSGRRLHSWTLKLTDPVENYAFGVAFSPDGSKLAIGATDHLIHGWDLRTGAELPVLRGHEWYVTGLVFAPDGRTLYSVGWDGAVRRWDVESWRELRTPGVAATGLITCAPGISTLAWEEDGGILHIADAASGKLLRTLPGNRAGFSCLKFSPDGGLLAAGGNDLSMQLWDVASGKLLRQWSWPKGKDPHACVNDIAFAPDGKTFATAGFRTNDMQLWETATGTCLGRVLHQMAAGVAFAPDGQTLVSVGWDRSLRRWHVPDLRALGAVTSPEKLVKGAPADRDPRFQKVAYSPDGELLATLNLGGGISVWNAATQTLLHSFQAALGQCNLSFSPDGQWLTTGGYDGQLALWEARSGQAVLKLPGHQARVFAVAFGPDGRTLLSGSDDRTALMWDLKPSTNQGDISIDALWTNLSSTNATVAYQAIWRLAGQPERSVPFLKSKLLTPVKPPNRQRLPSLFEHLDSERFAEREGAFKELSLAGGAIEADLRQELTRRPSLEKKARLEKLLDLIAAEIASKDARQARALVVLKWADTREARQVLEELAKGVPSRLTTQARATLRR